MKIQDILRVKGRGVVTIAGDETVLDAVQRLVEHNIGGLVVVEKEQPIGILTERDILRLTARSAGALGSIQIRTVMTRDLITATPEHELLSVMEMMTRHKVRHLPVIKKGRLAGIVSIGDLLNACRMMAEEENALLRDYIQQAR